MDSSSIANTNKRRQQQQQQQQSTTKGEQIHPCTNTNRHNKKNSLSLQKLQVLHQHQILKPIFFFGGDYFFCRIASFASTQLY